MPLTRVAAARLVLALLATLGAAGCATATPAATASGTSAAAEGPGGSTAVETNAVVRRVIDGDTIEVERSGVKQTVRLIGIDTPETKKPGTPIECFGHEASAHMHELLPDATAVRLERDAEEHDRYDRVLAYVYRSDGEFVNLAMVRDGYAGQLTIPPNVAHVDELTAAAREARERELGLWKACGGNHVAGDRASGDSGGR